MAKLKVKMKYKYIKFFWVTLEEFNLNPARGLLLYLIYNLAERIGYCYSSKTRLAKELNVTSVTVYKMLVDLEKRELIRRVPFNNPEMGTRAIVPTKKTQDHFEKLKYKVLED